MCVLLTLFGLKLDVWLEFDGRHLRRPENKAAYLSRLHSCKELSMLEIQELTSDILIRSVPFTDSSIEAVRGREPVLITQVVECLARLHQELPTDQLKA